MVLMESRQVCFIFRAFNEPFNTIPKIMKASPVTQMVENSPAIQETRVWSLGWEDPLDKGMAVHYSIVAWRIPWMEEPSWWATVHGATKSQTQMSD